MTPEDLRRAADLLEAGQEEEARAVLSEALTGYGWIGRGGRVLLLAPGEAEKLLDPSKRDPEEEAARLAFLREARFSSDVLAHVDGEAVPFEKAREVLEAAHSVTKVFEELASEEAAD